MTKYSSKPFLNWVLKTRVFSEHLNIAGANFSCLMLLYPGKSEKKKCHETASETYNTKTKIAKHGSRIDAKLVACDVKDRSRQAKTAENLK